MESVVKVLVVSVASLLAAFALGIYWQCQEISHALTGVINF